MFLPYLTADLPGTGGRIRVRDTDFYVEEVPLYTPCGSGEHTYVTIEKVGLSTFQVIRLIADALGIDPREVGCAGLKDTHAVAVQTLSLGDVEPARVAALNLSGVRVLNVARHTNKLKMGHLRANRFVIRIREVTEQALPRARAVLDVLQRRGVPNYFGQQRFGVRGDTHLLGRALVRGEAESFVRRFVGTPHPAESPRVREARRLYDEGRLAESLHTWPRNMEYERRVVRVLLAHPGDWERAVRSVPSRMRKFFVSAYQSALFNRVLARRLSTFDHLQHGDLAWIHGKGAVFLVQDPADEQPRADRLEISPSGPLYGRKVKLAQGMPGEVERQVLAEEGLTCASFRPRGARRPLRFPLRDVQIWYEEGVMLAFTLPPGCYATAVLDEVIKDRATAGGPVGDTMG